MEKIIEKRNETAPIEKPLSMGDMVRAYISEVGFTPYATSLDYEVYCMPISEAISNYLFLFIQGSRMLIYQGIRTGLQIRARRLHTCRVHELEETFGLLAERNYL